MENSPVEIVDLPSRMVDLSSSFYQRVPLLSPLESWKFLEFWGGESFPKMVSQLYGSLHHHIIAISPPFPVASNFSRASTTMWLFSEKMVRKSQKGVNPVNHGKHPWLSWKWPHWNLQRTEEFPLMFPIYTNILLAHADFIIQSTHPARSTQKNRRELFEVSGKSRIHGETSKNPMTSDDFDVLHRRGLANWPTLKLWTCAMGLAHPSIEAIWAMVWRCLECRAACLWQTRHGFPPCCTRDHPTDPKCIVTRKWVVTLYI